MVLGEAGASVSVYAVAGPDMAAVPTAAARQTAPIDSRRSPARPFFPRSPAGILPGRRPGVVGMACIATSRSVGSCFAVLRHRRRVGHPAVERGGTAVRAGRRRDGVRVSVGPLRVLTDEL